MDSDGSSEYSTSSSSVLSADFPLNDDMNSLWLNCLRLAQSYNAQGISVVHPLHLALVLLYNDLVTVDDLRLLDPSAFRLSLDRSLFWSLISKSAKFQLPDTFDDHLRKIADRDLSSYTSMYNAACPQVVVGLHLHYALQDSDLDNMELSQSDAKDGILEYCLDSTRCIFEYARETQRDRDDAYIAPHHILLALLKDREIRRILTRMSVNADADMDTNVDVDVEHMENLIDRTSRILKNNSRNHFPLLRKYATNLTELAQQELTRRKSGRGRPLLNPITGRNYEIRRLMSILSRRTKNSAVLLGDSGVGKTAIAESLALRIIEGDVAEPVSTRVFSLDLVGLLASTACQSTYEVIIAALLEEIAKHEELGIKVILFIEDLGQITIGGYRADGVGLDAASLMKPYLARGILRCIGCATFEEYRSTIEKDGALSRQFSPVYVCQPKVGDTIDILRGLKDVIQSFHRVHVLDTALQAAASLASRYFAHKRLPDAAIDLIEEACSMIRADRGNIDQLIQWKRQKLAFELEIRALEREMGDTSSRELILAAGQLQELDKKIEGFHSYREKLKPLQKSLHQLDFEIAELQQTLRKSHEDKSIVNRKGLLDRLHTCQTQREQVKARLDRIRDGNDFKQHPCFPQGMKIVSAQDVAIAASYYTFVPWSEAPDSPKRQRMARVSEILAETVVGQPEAVEAISASVRCMLAGLTDPSRPIASVMFGGPSGVGKKLLVKAVSRLLLQPPDKVVCINGGDYTEPHHLTKLIGTPECTGFDHGGQLTECVRRRPFSIIHINDLEKACIEFRMKIQTLLEDGYLVDGADKTVDFSNCLVVITTSVGQGIIKSGPSRILQNRYMQAIREQFPVEFLARLDDIIIFNELSDDDIATIIDARLEELRKQVRDLGLSLVVDGSVNRYLARRNYGRLAARELDRIITSHVLRPLAQILLHDAIDSNGTILLRVDRPADGIMVTSTAESVAEGGSDESSDNESCTVVSSEEYDDEGMTDSVRSYEELAPEADDSAISPGLQVQPQRIF